MPRRQAGARMQIKIYGRCVSISERALLAGGHEMRLATGENVDLASYASSVAEFVSALNMDDIAALQKALGIRLRCAKGSALCE